MKTLLTLLSLSFAASTLAADPVKFFVSSKGVEIDAGVCGQVTMAPPVVVGIDKKDRKPVFTAEPDGKTGKALYADTSSITVTVSPEAGTITYSFDGVADAASVRLASQLPLSFNLGGSYALNDGDPKPFPIDPAKQLFDQGAFGKFDLLGSTGNRLSFAVPTTYQQLQDNRVWGQQAYSWNYFYDLLRYPGQTSFTITVTAAASPVK